MSAQVTLVGRLGTDPELRFANSGKAVASLRVVTDRRVKKGDEWVSEDTTWWQVTGFGKLAEQVGDRLRKGDPVIVVGRVRGREWEDPKTGEKRSSLEVVADTVGLDLARVKNASQGPSGDPWANPSPDASRSVFGDEAPF